MFFFMNLFLLKRFKGFEIYVNKNKKIENVRGLFFCKQIYNGGKDEKKIMKIEYIKIYIVEDLIFLFIFQYNIFKFNIVIVYFIVWLICIFLVDYSKIKR